MARHSTSGNGRSPEASGSIDPKYTRIRFAYDESVASQGDAGGAPAATPTSLLQVVPLVIEISLTFEGPLPAGAEPFAGIAEIRVSDAARPRTLAAIPIAACWLTSSSRTKMWRDRGAVHEIIHRLRAAGTPTLAAALRAAPGVAFPIVVVDAAGRTRFEGTAVSDPPPSAREPAGAGSEGTEPTATAPPPRASLPIHPDDALPGDGALPADVGTATMAADRTLRMNLRSVEPDGTIAEALLVIPPGDPRHDRFVTHLGGIMPGQSKPIPPFEDEVVDPDSVR